MGIGAEVLGGATLEWAVFLSSPPTEAFASCTSPPACGHIATALLPQSALVPLTFCYLG